MTTLRIISLIITCCAFFICYRSGRAYELQMSIYDMFYRLAREGLKNNSINKSQLRDLYERIVKKHSFRSMVFSLKPLKLKYWYTEEEINELNGKL